MVGCVRLHLSNNFLCRGVWVCSQTKRTATKAHVLQSLQTPSCHEVMHTFCWTDGCKPNLLIHTVDGQKDQRLNKRMVKLTHYPRIGRRSRKYLHRNSMMRIIPSSRCDAFGAPRCHWQVGQRVSFSLLERGFCRHSDTTCWLVLSLNPTVDYSRFFSHHIRYQSCLLWLITSNARFNISSRELSFSRRLLFIIDCLNR